MKLRVEEEASESTQSSRSSTAALKLTHKRQAETLFPSSCCQDTTKAQRGTLKPFDCFSFHCFQKGISSLFGVLATPNTLASPSSTRLLLYEPDRIPFALLLISALHPMMVNASRHPRHHRTLSAPIPSTTGGISDEHTRTRLLNRLGLFQAPNGKTTVGRKSGYAHSSLSPQNINLRTTLHPSLVRNGGQRRTSTLKGINHTCDSSSLKQQEGREQGHKHSLDRTTSASSSEDGSANSSNHRVKFNETVDIVSIPSRHQFSNRIKRVYWSSKEEICSNAERNILEYEYEGWDYHNVVLDEDMYIDTATGALVHPCHLSLDEEGQPVYHQYAEDDAEQSKALSEQQQQQEEDDDDDDDSYFKPLTRQSSVASAQ